MAVSSKSLVQQLAVFELDMACQTKCIHRVVARPRAPAMQKGKGHTSASMFCKSCLWLICPYETCSAFAKTCSAFAKQVVGQGAVEFFRGEHCKTKGVEPGLRTPWRDTLLEMRQKLPKVQQQQRMGTVRFIKLCSTYGVSAKPHHVIVSCALNNKQCERQINHIWGFSMKATNWLLKREPTRWCKQSCYYVSFCCPSMCSLLVRRGKAMKRR